MTTTTTNQSELARKQRVHIRWMIRRDMPEVLNIERSCFEFPWVEGYFVECLRQRNCIGMVAEHSERAVGFMVYELHKTRLHILNFAVAPHLHGKYIGSQMVAKLISKLSRERRRQITAEVPETKLPALCFFRHHGFKAKETLRGHYLENDDDAIAMEYRIPQ